MPAYSPVPITILPSGIYSSLESSCNCGRLWQCSAKFWCCWFMSAEQFGTQGHLTVRLSEGKVRTRMRHALKHYQKEAECATCLPLQYARTHAHTHQSESKLKDCTVIQYFDLPVMASLGEMSEEQAWSRVFARKKRITKSKLENLKILRKV